MTDENQPDEAEAIRQLYAFVIDEMEAGSDRNTIAQKLIDHGVARQDAERMTNSIVDELTAAAEKERFEASALVPGLLGGLLGAVAGAAVWAGIAIVTDYELGILAWGLGGLCGYAVVVFTGGKKGLPLQFVAVATSVLGIVLGKYLTLYYFLRESYLQEGAAELSVVSAELLSYFLELLPDMLSPIDALWVILAVLTAWRLPKASDRSINPAEAQNPIRPA